MFYLRFAKAYDHSLPTPMRKTALAAGFDLPCAESWTLMPNEQALLGTGWRVALPEGCCGQIWPRSGWAAQHQIDRRAGLIDADYRGEIKVLLRNESDTPWRVNPGDRIAQLVVVSVVNLPPLEVAYLDPTERGSDGFGSTGKRG